MAASIEQARREVQSAFEGTVRCAEAEDVGSFVEFDARLWTCMLALGRALVLLFLLKQAARPRPARYRHEGKDYVLSEKKTKAIGTRYGKVPFRRLIGRPVGNPKGKCDPVIDRDLGMCGGFSLEVVMTVALLAAQMSFANVRRTYRRFYEWAPSPRAILRMVDTIGDEARPFLEQAGAPDDDGEILFIQADGKGAPMITSAEYRKRRQRHQPKGSNKRHSRRRSRVPLPRRRRTKGKKSKNCKVAVVGAIYTLRRTANGLEGPINKRVYATFESHEALFVWLRHEADKRGYGTKTTVFLGDGSAHIWRNKAIYFPDAIECIDWCHVVEKLWKAGECIFPEGSDKLREWIGKQAGQLRRGAAKAVITTLKSMLQAVPPTGPGNKGKRTRLQKTITYYESHVDRMAYDQMRAKDYDIGTGVIEGAVRHLMCYRLDGPGMRWSKQRSERVLHLRCILINGQWEEFERHLAVRKGLTLAAQPEVARTYDATPNKKAA